MPIKVISGTPGAGKTLMAVALIEAELAKASPRPIYVNRLNGYTDPRVHVLEDVLKWQDCPDGSLIVVDEAHEVFVNQGRGVSGPPIPPIAALATHRHRGFDFILVTQHPQLLSTQVRKWVGEHVHLLRKFGTSIVDTVTWSECVTDTQGIGSRARGVGGVWKHPPHLFAKYHSATVHTVKKRVPLRVFALPLVVLFAAGALYAYSSGSASVVDVEAGATSAPAEAPPARTSATIGAPRTSSGVRKVYEDGDEYARAHMPRIDGKPWSAAVYDGLKPTTVPELYCMSAASRCKCISEQGTRVEVGGPTCRHIAANGVYNPYRKRDRASERRRGDDKRDDSSVADRARSAPAVDQREERQPVGGGGAGLQGELERFPPPTPTKYEGFRRGA